MTLYQPTRKMYNLARNNKFKQETTEMKKDIDYFDCEFYSNPIVGIAKGMLGEIDKTYSSGYATVSDPAYDINTTTRVYYPSTSNRTCDCGDTCTCVGRAKPNMKFEDILDDVESVIFNEPATIVTFSDGSKVCVKACSKDTFNKETGLIYAIIKRLYANEVERKTGYLRSTGLGEKIAKILKNAVDQKEKERERRRKQKEKQAKKEKAEAEKANAEAEKETLANEVSEQAAKEAVDQIYNEQPKK